MNMGSVDVEDSLRLAKADLMQPVAKQQCISTTDTDKLQALFDKQQEILAQQSEEIKSLKEIQNQLTDLSIKKDKEREDNMELIQKCAVSEFKRITEDFNKQCEQRFQDFNKDSDREQRDNQRVQNLSKLVEGLVNVKLESIVKNQLNETVLPALERGQASYLQNATNLVEQKYTLWSNTVKEEIKRIITSRSFTDSIARMAASTVEEIIPKLFRETIYNTLIPGFEDAVKSIASQIEQTFHTGVLQYLKHLENQLHVLDSNQQIQKDSLLVQMQEIQSGIEKSTQKLKSTVETDLKNLLYKELTNSADKTVGDFSNIIEEKITSLVQTEMDANTDRSLEEISVKPAVIETEESPCDSDVNNNIQLQEEILKLICDCDVESAFIKALGARDVSYVIMVCQMLDGTCAGELFESGCLGGHVVFPLIQQLCHDLTVDTEIKISYLQYSFMALSNTGASKTCPQGSEVLETAHNQLRIVINDRLASEENIRKLKILAMTCKNMMSMGCENQDWC